MLENYPTGDLKPGKSPYCRRRYPKTSPVRLIFTVFIIISNALVFGNHLTEAAYCQGFSIQDLKAENQNLFNADVDDPFFTNPHLINLTWLEPDDAVDCTEVVVQMKLNASPRLADSLSSFIVKASEPTTSSGGFRERTASLSTSLSPAASYDVTIVDESATLSNVANFSTAPVAPPVVTAELHSSGQYFSVTIKDRANVDLSNVKYLVAIKGIESFSYEDVLGAQLSDPTIQAYKNYTISILPKTGACAYQVSVKTEYRVDYPSAGESNTRPIFLTRPVPVSAVQLAAIKKDFQYEVDVTWTDGNNCPYTIGLAALEFALYNVKIRQLVSSGSNVVASFNTPAGTYQLKPQLINVAPASRYYADVTVVTPEGVSAADASNEYICSDPSVITKLEILVGENGIEFKITDNENYDIDNIKYNLDIFSVDTGLTKPRMVDADGRQTNETVAVNDLDKAGACRYQVTVTSVYSVTCSKDATLPTNLESASQAFSFTTLPMKVSNVKTSWTERPFQNPHVFGISWDDDSNCRSNDNFHLYNVKVVDVTQSLNTSFQTSELNLNNVAVNLAPASFYHVEVVATAGNSASDIETSQDTIYTAPVEPQHVNVEVIEGGIKVTLYDNLNVNRQKIVYNLEVRNTSDVVLTGQIVGSESEVQVTGEFDLSKVTSGTCKFKLTVTSHYIPIDTVDNPSPPTKDYEFSTLPAKVEDVDVTWLKAAENYDPYAVNITWKDVHNCPDTLHTVNIYQMTTLGTSSLVTTREAMGGNLVEAEINLVPAARHTVQVVTASSANNVVESESYICSNPAVITKLSIGLTSNSVDFSIIDNENSDIDNIKYNLDIFSVDTGLTKPRMVDADGRQTNETVPVNDLDKAGACRYQVTVISVYSVPCTKDSPLLSNLEAQSQAFSFTTLPMKVSNVKTSWTERPFQNPHVFNISWEDDSNCKSSDNFHLYSVKIYDAALTTVALLQTSEVTLDNVAINLAPANAYQINVTAVAGDLLADPEQYQERIYTSPVAPKSVQIAPSQLGNGYTVTITDDANIDKANIIYNVEIFDGKGDLKNQYNIPAFIDSSETTSIINLSGTSNSGCQYSLTVSSLYAPSSVSLSSAKSIPIIFTTPPAKVSAVRYIKPPQTPSAFKNPHKLNVFWQDTANCLTNDVIYKVNVIKVVSPTVDDYFDSLTTKNKSILGFPINLLPGANYRIEVASYANKELSEWTFADEHIYTVPMPPQTFSVEVDSQTNKFEVDITDQLNADKATLEYALQVSNNGAEIPMDPRVIASVTSSTITVDIPLLKLPKPGACLNKLTIVSHYTAPSNPSNDIPSEPTLPVAFVPPPLKVTNVDFSWSSKSFKNPYSLDVFWNDEANCVGEVVLYNVEIHQLQPDSGDNLLIATFRSSKTELTDIRVNLSPASRYVVSVVPFAGNNFGPAAESEKYIYTGPVPAQHIDFQVDSDKVTATITDLENVDRARLIYELAISGNDGLYTKTYHVPADSTPHTVLELSVADLGKLGTCLYQVLATTYYTVPTNSSPSSPSENVTSEPSLPHTFTTLPKPVSSVEVAWAEQSIQNLFSVNVSWTDSDNCQGQDIFDNNNLIYNVRIKRLTTAGQEIYQSSFQSQSTHVFNLQEHLAPAARYVVDVVAVGSNTPSTAVASDKYIYTDPVAPQDTVVTYDSNANSIKVLLLDDQNADQEDLAFTLTITGNDGNFKKTYTTQASKPNFTIATSELAKSGACRYVVSAISQYKVVTSSSSSGLASEVTLTSLDGDRVEFMTMAGKVSQVTTSLQPKKVELFENPQTVKASWYDYDNCKGKDMVNYLNYLVEITSSTTSVQHLVPIDGTLQTNSLISAAIVTDLAPASSYSLTVKVVVSPARSEDSKMISAAEQTKTSLQTAPVTPIVFYWNKETSNAFAVTLYDKSNYNGHNNLATSKAISYSIFVNSAKQNVDPSMTQINVDTPYFSSGEILLSKLPDFPGACDYRVTALSNVSGHSSIFAHPPDVLVETSPRPVSSVSAQLQSETSVTLRFDDSENCPPSSSKGENPFYYTATLSKYIESDGSALGKHVMSVDMKGDLKQDTITVPANALKPACLYTVDVVARRKNGPHAEAKQSSPIPIAPKAPSELSLSEVVDVASGSTKRKIVVTVERDDENCISPQLTYDGTLNRVVNSTYSVQTPFSLTQSSLSKSFVFGTDLNVDGSCEYQVIAKSRFYSSQSANTAKTSLLITSPVKVSKPIAKVTISRWENSPLPGTIDFSVDVTFSDPKNCPDSDVESEDGTKKRLTYQVTLKETLASTGQTLNSNTQSAVTKFTLLNARPGTSYKVTVQAIVETIKGSATLATMASEESSTTFTVDPVSPETWLVDENSNHFTLGIYDPFNTKWQAETPSALGYVITPVAYKNYQIGGLALQAGETSADLPYYHMAKPPKGGACYYNVTSRSVYKDLGLSSSSYPTPLVLTTDPAAVQFDPVEIVTETLPTSGVTDGSNVLIGINWLDDLNCDQVGLLYDGVVSLTNYRSWYDDDLNRGENVEVTTETFEADKIRSLATKRVSANIKLADIAPGCLFSVAVASQIKDLSEEEDGSLKYRKSQPASQTFVSTPLPPSKLLVSDHNATHILVELGGDRRMTCFLGSQQPSFVVTVDRISTGQTIAETLTFNELYSQDNLSGKLEVEKPKFGACDYRIQAKTTSFGKTSSATSTYLETEPVAPESASVSIVGSEDNVIKLINGSIADYNSLSVTIGWNDLQNCPDDGTNHIYHCSQIVEQEREVEILTGTKQPLCYGASANGVTPSLKLADVLKSEPNGGAILTPGCSFRAIVTVEHISKHSTVLTKKISLPATSSNEILVEPADVTDVKATASANILKPELLDFLISWKDELNCPSSDRIKYKATVYRCVIDDCEIVEEKLIAKSLTRSSDYKTTFTVDPAIQPEGTLYRFRVASVLLKGGSGSDSDVVLTTSSIANQPPAKGTAIDLPVKPPDNLWIIIVSVTVSFVVILSVIIIGFMFYRRRTRLDDTENSPPKQPETRQSFKQPPPLPLRSLNVTADNRNIGSTSDISSLGATMNSRFSMQNSLTESGAMPIDQFVDYVERVKQNRIELHDQFLALSEIGRNQSCADGSNAVVKAKNRYNDIIPYDHSRVKLRTPKGITLEAPADYINACYIEGLGSSYQQGITHIAAQGPKTNTVNDFWQMIWQEGVDIVVMLTTLVENGKVRCEAYWPQEQGDVKEYGDFVVENVGSIPRDAADLADDEISGDNFARRTILEVALKNPEGAKKRTVTHYQFLNWPDKSIPKVDQLLGFLRTVINHQQRIVTRRRRRSKPNTADPAQGTKSSPLLVHCSAGVGRTGVFISLDLALRRWILNPPTDAIEASARRAPSIFSIVEHLRKARPSMVQTEEQYLFLHILAAELLSQYLQGGSGVRNESTDSTTNNTQLSQSQPPPLPAKPKSLTLKRDSQEAVF